MPNIRSKAFPCAGSFRIRPQNNCEYITAPETPGKGAYHSTAKVNQHFCLPGQRCVAPSDGEHGSNTDDLSSLGSLGDGNKRAALPGGGSAAFRIQIRPGKLSEISRREKNTPEYRGHIFKAFSSFKVDLAAKRGDLFVRRAPLNVQKRFASAPKSVYEVLKLVNEANFQNLWIEFEDDSKQNPEIDETSFQVLVGRFTLCVNYMSLFTWARCLQTGFRPITVLTLFVSDSPEFQRTIE